MYRSSTSLAAVKSLHKLIHHAPSRSVNVGECIVDVQLVYATDFLLTRGEDPQDCLGQATTINIGLLLAMSDMGAGPACASISGEPVEASLSGVRAAVLRRSDCGCDVQ